MSLIWVSLLVMLSYSSCGLSFAVRRSFSQWSPDDQLVSKRFFSYSSGWGPGGYSVSGNNHLPKAHSPSPSSTSSMLNQLADQYDRNGRISNCASCEHILESLRAELENHENLEDLSEEEIAEIEAKIDQLLEAVRKWKEAKARANVKSKRSVLRWLTFKRIRPTNRDTS